MTITTSPSNPEHPSADSFSEIIPLKRLRLSKRATLMLVFLAILMFVTLPVYQSIRQPRIGDSDNMRLGLMVLNRYARDSFPRDAAMQAGTWWPGYTPWYLAAVGAGFHLFGDIGIAFGIITAVNYLSLMIGFFCLGRRMGLPIWVSLTLAYMSGLYQVTGGALAWAGVGNEMATPRNIYLALLPWILILCLKVYRSAAHKPFYWLALGAVIGASTILHSITGGFILSVLCIMMFAGAIAGHFDWRNLILFVAAALPGTYVGYRTINTSFEVSAAISDPSAIPFVYSSIARANVFFYRLPNWAPFILIFTILTLLVGGYVLRNRWLKKPLPQGFWMALGLLQALALLLTLLVDWWTLLFAVEWIRQTRNGKISLFEKLSVLYLAAVNFSTLSLSALVSVAGNRLDSYTFASVARLLQRGQALGYAGLIVLTCFILWDRLRTYPSRILFLLLAVATFVTGLHLAEFETITGSWLPFDYWIYLGVLLLLAWPHLEQGMGKSLRSAGTAMLVLQAVTRVLASPATVLLTVLVGVVVFAADWLYPFAQKALVSRAKWLVAGAASFAILAILVLPISSGAFLPQMLTNARQALLRNWSRIDSLSYFSTLYPVGTWLRENTPPDSLVYTVISEMRYWSLRSQTIGRIDPKFLNNYPDLYPKFRADYQEALAAYTDAAKIVPYARQVGADYILLPQKAAGRMNLSPDDVTEVYRDTYYVVLAVHPA